MTLWWGAGILAWVALWTLIGAADRTFERGAGTWWLGALVGFGIGAGSAGFVWMIAEVIR